jgi:putative ABC transport system substrate-binding protein
MRRREFITLLGSAAAWPLAARAQQPAMPIIGILASVSPAPYAPFIAAIKEGLRQTGYVEGRNVAIEYRWAEGQYDRLPQLASELVQSGVAVMILVGGGATTAAPKPRLRRFRSWS